MNYIFPLSFAINFFAMTGFMVVLGLFGKSELAADIGIVQGATLALFYAFSANARNLILNPSSRISIRELLFTRLILLFPLGTIAFFLSVSLTGVNWLIAIILIIRRGTEWLCELHLSQVEVMKNKKFAKKFVISQIATLIAAVLCTFFLTNYFWIGILFWALMPLLMLIAFVRENFIQEGIAYDILLNMIPHFGSTAITGITVYVFRLIILLLTGKAMAGDLYTAFAIGSLMGSAFVNALGPSLAYENSSKDNIILPSWLKFILVSTFVGGLFIFASAEMNFDMLALFNKSFFFWSATGLSLIGGSLMLMAQRFRISLLQLHGEQDVLEPDLITNLLILSFVPFAYYLIGQNMLKCLYLINAFIAFFIYWSAKHSNLLKQLLTDNEIAEKITLMIIALILIFPIFFQLSGNIFIDPIVLFDTGGNLKRLPIPFSVFACFGGLLVFGNMGRSKNSLYMLFFTFVVMLIATLISTKDFSHSQRDKFILLFQFILPMFALILGQNYGSEELDTKILAKAALIMLSIIVPFQLFSTWHSGMAILSPNMYFFSIYQQLQYVPTILICLYIHAFYSLWRTGNYRKILIILAPLIGIYAILSGSRPTIIALYSGLLLFAWLTWYRTSEKLPVFIVLIMILLSGMTISQLNNKPIFHASFIKKLIPEKPTKKFRMLIIDNKFTDQYGSYLPSRGRIWKYHLDNIISNPKCFLFGNPNRPARNEYPSAHNYYLDLAFNFGVLSLIPIVCLFLITIRKIIKIAGTLLLDKSLLGLVLITIFLLLIDNSFKVGLRQPYPGIITFFLWGLLLSKLTFKQSTLTVKQHRNIH
jgi:hypothetical protein